MVKNKGGGKKTKKLSFDFNAFWAKHWAKVLIVVLAFGILGFIGVNKLIIYNQKKQFDAAEASLDKLYADIVAQVGQPTDMKKDKSCGYASTEWGNGERACGISYATSYDVSNADDANTISNKIREYIYSNKLIQVLFEQKGSFSDGRSSVSSEDPAFDIHIINVNEKNCSISSKYLDKNNPGSSILKNKINVNFGCSGRARAEFYPVKN